MVEGLLKRAKAFIGLDEEEGEDKSFGQQLDMGPLLKNKREPKSDAAFEIISYEPKVYEDSLNISTHLRSGCPVLINLKHLDPSEGTRLIDFVCGTAYAIDGHMMKIGDSIFLFTPNTIAITSADDKSNSSEGMGFERGNRDTFFSR